MPDVGRSTPVIIRARVDFPLPLCPTSAVTPPRCSTKLAFFTASVRVTFVPRRWTKVLDTSSTVSSSSAVRAPRSDSLGGLDELRTDERPG